jgi:hypothetical protein
MDFFGMEFLAGLVVGLIIGLILKSRGERQDLTGVPTSMAANMPRSPQGTSPGSMPPPPPATTGQTLSPGSLLKVGAALAAGNKIEAIKLLREASGLGLKEAKDAVERMERK